MYATSHPLEVNIGFNSVWCNLHNDLDIYKSRIKKLLQNKIISHKKLAALAHSRLINGTPGQAEFLTHAAKWASHETPLSPWANITPRSLSIYAGIGARELPKNMEKRIAEIAAHLAAQEIHLRTGGATGSDNAFFWAAGKTNTTLCLPWRGYNDHQGPHTLTLTQEQMKAASQTISAHHPAWTRCSGGAKSLHARNAAIVLGPNLDSPVDLVIAYTEDGHIRGGTATAIRLALHYNIPVINLGAAPREDLRFLFTRITGQPG